MTPALMRHDQATSDPDDLLIWPKRRWRASGSGCSSRRARGEPQPRSVGRDTRLLAQYARCRQFGPKNPGAGLPREPEKLAGGAGSTKGSANRSTGLARTRTYPKMRSLCGGQEGTPHDPAAHALERSRALRQPTCRRTAPTCRPVRRSPHRRPSRQPAPPTPRPATSAEGAVAARLADTLARLGFEPSARAARPRASRCTTAGSWRWR